MNVLHKALERGLSPANVLSWLCQQWLVRWGRLWGTLALRIKACLLGVRVGRGVRAHGPVGLLRWPGGEIRIGDRVQMISSWRRATASTIAAPVRLRVFGPGAVIEIGEGSELSGTSITARSTHISIGKQVLIAPDCAIVDSDFHAPWPCEARASAPGMERDAPVVIEDYAWIGMRSVILKGVRIGRGAIVGAGSVVTRDVPAGCTACGVPAKIVKQAPTEGATSTLLRPENL